MSAQDDRRRAGWLAILAAVLAVIGAAAVALDMHDRRAIIEHVHAGKWQ